MCRGLSSRRYLPRFVYEAGRDMRNLTPELSRDWVLDHPWMKPRLFRMAAILRDRRTTMKEYVDHLRELEQRASADNPTPPALDAIIRDHQASGWKTLSVFVRDCVGGRPASQSTAESRKNSALTSCRSTSVSL